MKIEVVERDYQPINTTQTGGGGVQVLVAMRNSVGGHGKGSGNPSLVLVLVKTYGLQFLVSVIYKVCSDILDFANPLILK